MKFILLFFLISQFVTAQDLTPVNQTVTSPEVTQKKWNASAFIEYTDHSFLLSTGVGRSSLEFPEKRLLFSPSNAPEAGVSISRGIYTFQYRTYIKSMENIVYGGYDTGKSSLTDWRFKGKFNFFEFELYFQKFSGFFVDLNAKSGFTVSQGEANPGSSVNINQNNKEGPQIIVRPNIISYNYGIKPQIIFPLIAPRSQFSIIPVKEGYLGFIFKLATGLHRLDISGSTPFVPDERKENFPEDFDVESIAQNIFNLGMGSDFMIYPNKHWALSMGGGIEEEFIYQKIKRASVTRPVKNSFNLGQILSFDIGLDYERNFHQLELFFNLELRMSKLASANFDSKRSVVGSKYSYSF